MKVGSKKVYDMLLKYTNHFKSKIKEKLISVAYDINSKTRGKNKHAGTCIRKLINSRTLR